MVANAYNSFDKLLPGGREGSVIKVYKMYFESNRNSNANLPNACLKVDWKLVAGLSIWCGCTGEFWRARGGR